jgi:hypothetical protein
MSPYDNIGDLSNTMVLAIQAVTRGHIVVEGIIEDVDETAFTASVKTGDATSPATYFNVPLRVLISQQASIIEVPKIGTQCIICFRDGNTGRPQLLAIHEALKILVNCDSIVFNSGSLGGMVKVEDLITRLNKIEQDVNNLKSVFSGWVPAPNDGGAALKSAAASWSGQQLTPTQKNDIENPKIKQ